MKEQKQLRDIRVLLGPDATEEQVAEVHEVIESQFPGVTVHDLPPDAWRWIMTGEGAPPIYPNIPPRASRLLSLFSQLSDTRQAKLLQMADTLARHGD